MREERERERENWTCCGLDVSIERWKRDDRVSEVGLDRIHLSWQDFRSMQ